MKVLHLAAGNLFGGIETYLLTLARLRHLCPAMEPHFGLCFPGRLREELIAAGVPIHDLGAVRVSRVWTVMNARWRLKRILREVEIEAVVTHGTWPHAIFGPTVKRAERRLVNVVHGPLDRKHWINRWAARTRPDAVIANSRFTAPSAVALFPGVPITTVHYPVTPSMCNREVARCEIRAELNTSSDTVVILQTSRLEEWKGQRIHVQALGRLKDVTGWQAWFAGGPQKRGEAEFLLEMKALADRVGIADRVKFLGQRADVPTLTAAADVFCQPNTEPEPFGIVFIEALHAGLPVVSSSFGGALEIITAACGLLCPPADIAALAEALRRLIGDARLRKTLGEAGPARATQLCDPAVQMAELAQVVAGENDAIG